MQITPYMDSKNTSLFGETPEKKENFEPIKPKNTFLRVFFVFFLLGLLGFSIYFFFLRKKNISKEEEMIASEIAAEFTENQVLPIEEEVQVEKFEDPPAPEIVHLKNRSNEYYIIIGSFVDKYFAEDLAKKVLAKGKTAYIIHPERDSVYYFVGIHKSNSKEDLQKKSEEYRQDFEVGGSKLWIKKF